MSGTIFSAVTAIRLMPPRVTAPTSNTRVSPVAQVGTPKPLTTDWASVLDCTMLPIPKAASPARKAYNTASQRHCAPSPFSM